MNRDYVEMLNALSAAGVEFMVIGAHALAAHGYVRATNLRILSISSAWSVYKPAPLSRY